MTCTLGTAALQKRLQPLECKMNRALFHDVRVEHDIDLAIVEGDRLPVRERHCSSVLITAAPVPDSKQGDATEILRYGGVGLPGALSDEERPLGVAEPFAGHRWHVQHHARTRNSLILDWLAIPNPWYVRPKLICGNLPSDIPDRDEEGRYQSLGSAESKALQLGPTRDRAAATCFGDLGR